MNTKNLKIAIYSDRLVSDFFGGAEIYSLRLAEILSSENNVTMIFAKFDNWKNRVQQISKEYFSDSQTISKINFIPISGVLKIFDRTKLEIAANDEIRDVIQDNYDLFINISNNCVCGMPITKSIAMIHFPIDLKLPKSNLIKAPVSYFRDLKHKSNYENSYSMFIGNSKFTRNAINRYHNTNAQYIYPPILAQNVVSKNNFVEKKNQILSLGRIASDKNIEYQIKSYKKLQDKSKNDYKLIIAGMCSDKKYLKQLITNFNNYDIEIKVNLSTNEIKKICSESKIYWHTKGYQTEHDWQKEHFGMTTVEAMSLGCVPIVFNGGGQPEIVNKKCGFTWNSTNELINYTEEVINNIGLQFRLSQNSINRANDFTYEKYLDHFKSILETVT